MKLAGLLIIVSLGLYAFVKGKSTTQAPSPKGMMPHLIMRKTNKVTKLETPQIMKNPFSAFAI